jgi:hypothetical protein
MEHVCDVGIKSSVMYKLCKMATKPPTVAKLKELLKLAEVAYSSKDKKDDIVSLVQ